VDNVLSFFNGNSDLSFVLTFFSQNTDLVVAQPKPCHVSSNQLLSLYGYFTLQ